jgi:hypothetical protein
MYTEKGDWRWLHFVGGRLPVGGCCVGHLARALQAAPSLTCISRADIFLLSHSLARQEDTTSLLLVAPRVPRNRFEVSAMI